VTEKHDAIVVGGGVSGLTAAAYLARAKLSVILLEKNEKCGGLVNTFVKDGFLFDGGVRALESAGIILPMIRDLEISLETIPSPVSIGIEQNVIHVTTKESLMDYESLLKTTYPDSCAEIGKVILVIKKIMKDMEVLYGVDNPLFKNFRNDRSYFIKSYIPWFFKFIFTVRRINKLNIPVEKFLADMITNRSLMDIIGQHFFENTPAFFAMSYFYLYQDYFYPRGGVGKLAKALENKILTLGGEIKTGTEIIELSARDNRVIDAEGKSYQYGTLVWAADLKTLYQITRTEGLPEDHSKKIKKYRDTLSAKHGADSVFILFLELDAPPEYFKTISYGHLFYTPSKQGLGETHRRELRDLLKRWPTITRQELFTWLDKFCQLNTYEISIPALKEPGSAPHGKTGMIISTLFDYALIKKVSESGWYEEFKQEIENRIVEVLSNSIYPKLKEKVILKFSATPLSIEKSVGSLEGSIVGWSFTEPIPVTSSMLGINEASKTCIPNVLKAGQWAYSPAGVPTSILTGRLAADVVIKKEKTHN